MGDGVGGEARLILLLEDDRIQAEAVREFLSRHHFEVTHVASVEDARELLEKVAFDVVVLDRMLHRRDALAFVPEIQRRFNVPVIVASAHGDEVDRVLGLDRGADDYLTKPYSFQELLARIRAIHRRRRASEARLPSGRIVRFGDWRLDEAGYLATHEDGRTVQLPSGERAVLVSLLEHAGRVLARHELLALTRRTEGEVFDRSIDVLISRLRRRFDRDGEASIIRTVRGGGYQVAAKVQWL